MEEEENSLRFVGSFPFNPPTKQPMNLPTTPSLEKEIMQYIHDFSAIFLLVSVAAPRLKAYRRTKPMERNKKTNWKF